MPYSSSLAFLRELDKEPADTFTRNQHPDLRADFVKANPPFNINVKANPPFNIKECWDGKLEGEGGLLNKSFPKFNHQPLLATA